MWDANHADNVTFAGMACHMRWPAPFPLLIAENHAETYFSTASSPISPGHALARMDGTGRGGDFFAAPEPVGRVVLARVVGKGCNLDLLIERHQRRIMRPAL
jgi:hypothetical protein